MNAPIHKLKLFFYLSILTCLLSCSKNYTKFFEDEDNKNLSIFSNKNFNVASCYINNQPWRTRDRKTSSFITTTQRFEVIISRERTLTASDTLFIEWQGKEEVSAIGTNIRMAIPVAKDFTYKTFNQLTGQRMMIDGNSGYFQIESSTINAKGRGVLYIHQFQVDSTSAGYTGTFSGLFEAQLLGAAITKGRFDHAIENQLMILF